MNNNTLPDNKSKPDINKVRYIVESKKNKFSAEDAKCIFNVIDDYNETSKCHQGADGVNVVLDDLSDELVYDIYKIIERLNI